MLTSNTQSASVTPHTQIISAKVDLGSTTPIVVTTVPTSIRKLKITSGNVFGTHTTTLISPSIGTSRGQYKLVEVIITVLNPSPQFSAQTGKLSQHIEPIKTGLSDPGNTTYLFYDTVKQVLVTIPGSEVNNVKHRITFLLARSTGRHHRHDSD